MLDVKKGGVGDYRETFLRYSAWRKPRFSKIVTQEVEPIRSAYWSAALFDQSWVGPLQNVGGP
jgi:hypothetical protein